MKRYTKWIVSIVALTVGGSIYAQTIHYPCYKQIESAQFDKAQSQLFKQRAKDSTRYDVAFAIARLFASEQYTHHNIDSAYHWMVISYDSWRSLAENEQKKALKAGYTNEVYTEAITNLCQQAFANAKSNNTIEAYQAFIAQYPKAKQVKKAWKQIYKLKYEWDCSLHTEEAYRAHADRYPQSTYRDQALDKAERMRIERYIVADNWLSYKQYWQLYDNIYAPYKDTLSQQVSQLACRAQNIEALQWCIVNLQGPPQDSCWLALHTICLNQYTLLAFRQFHSDYAQYTTGKWNRADQYILDTYGRSLYGAATKKELIQLTAPHYYAFWVLRGMLEPYLAAKQWDRALEVMDEYKDLFADKYYFTDLYRVIQEQDSGDNAVSLGANVNTTTGNEYALAISADGKLLYFCGRNRQDNIGGEDIFVSKQTNGVWGKAQLVKDLSTASSNDAPLAVSADGNSILLFRNGSLMMAQKTAKGWASPVVLPDNINISHWQADAMITSDGKAMLFAASEKAENQFDETINIYVSLLQEDGQWGKPFSLGPTINTPFTDRSPFLHPDMKTLYFCSGGHGSIGDMDVFVSTRLNENSWTEWSTPVNMGKAINSTEAECWYKISTDGELAYFSKTVDDQQDLYQLRIPSHLRPQPVATISGTLKDSKGRPVVTTIRWEDLDTKEQVGQSQTDPEDGSFFIVLPEGKNYGYYIDDDKLFPVADNIDLKSVHKIVTIENNIVVASIEDMITDAVPMPLNNLFFETGKTDLLSTSENELKRVADIIRRLDLRVEISGHTDDVGDDRSNQLLSEQRAEAVRNYLVQNGIEANRILTIGYGETRPIASNKTSEGRRKNRRVEIRFLDQKKK